MEQLLITLEKIGQSAAFANSIYENNEIVINNEMLGEGRMSLTLADTKAMVDNLKGGHDIVCFIFSPAKEHEVPKEDNKPPKEDEPFDNEERDKIGNIA